MIVDGHELSKADVGRFVWLRVNEMGVKVVKLVSLSPLIVEDLVGERQTVKEKDLTLGHSSSLKRSKPAKMKA